MIRVVLAAALCLSLTLSASPARADFLTLNFAAVPGSVVSFDGTSKSFSFVDSASRAYAGNSFAVTSTTTAAGDDFSSPAVGLMGSIAGSFTINPASIVSSGGMQTASVSGTSVLTIKDGSGHNFTADLTFSSIYTKNNGGVIDAGGMLNLTNFAYSGSNADLVKLKDYLQGSLNVSFQFKLPGSVNLSTLTTSGVTTKSSFSGSLTASDAPLPGGLALAAAGFLSIGAARLVRRRKPAAS